MDILYFPQCSMHDKLTYEYLPMADGNINMMRNFIKEWQIHRPEDNFHILLPCTDEMIKYSNNNIPGNNYFYIEHSKSARTNRFNFPMDEFKWIIKEMGIRPQLIITDVIELAKNFRALCNVELNYNPKIVSNIRHTDEIDSRNMQYDYTLRVADGIIASDYVTILSQSMKGILGNNISNYFHADLVDEMLNKIDIFEPSISFKELNQYQLTFVPDKDNKIITFPGRLNKGEEKRTNYDLFQNAILELRKQRQDFTVYFTDPNNSMEEINYSWVKTIDKNRHQFLDLLNRTSVIVSLMNIQGFGGISIREGLLMGNTPVIPYNHEYIRMAPYNYEGFIRGEITVDKIVNSLNYALDNYNDFSNIAMQFTVEQQMKDLIKKLEVIINE